MPWKLRVVHGFMKDCVVRAKDLDEASSRAQELMQRGALLIEGLDGLGARVEFKNEKLDIN